MPPRRKATKKVNSPAKDSGASAGDGSAMVDGAAELNPAPNGVSASKSRRKTTRTQQDGTDRQTDMETTSATATNTEVSPAISSRTVVTPWDRESHENPIQGGGASNKIQTGGSNVGGHSNQVSRASQVSVSLCGDNAVLLNETVTNRPLYPAFSSAQAARSASQTSADCSASYVNSAASSAMNSRKLGYDTAGSTAIREVFAGCTAMTQAPVSHGLSSAVQYLPTTFPRETTGSTRLDTGGPQFYEEGQSQLSGGTTRFADTSRVANRGSQRRSLSASGYGPMPRPNDLTPHVDPPRYRPLDNSILLPTFDGYGDLNLFLQRFESIAKHCGWSPEELLFRMKQRITGDAEYVLGDTIHLTSAREFIEALKVRFGCEAHAERYRAELARLRRGTLTLEQLHLRVHSLISRAMPGPWSKATEIYARDAFLTALDDSDLRRRIMMACPPPETLSAVFDLAVRASAVDEVFRQQTRADSWEARPTERRQKYTRIIAKSNSDDDERSGDVTGRTELQRLMENQRKLQDELEVCRKRLEKAESALSARPAESSENTQPTPIAGRIEEKRSATTRSERIGFDVCRRCRQKGHWAKECPLTLASASGSSGPKCDSRGKRANLLTTTSRPNTRVYVQIMCEVSRFVPYSIRV
jgi:hypothetical protein